MFHPLRSPRRRSARLGALAVVGFVASTLVVIAPDAQAADRCDRVNDTVRKLLNCVTVEGVLEHEEAFQAIADANEGTRASGMPGYDASVDYVVETLTAAGYEVTRQPFEFNAFFILGPATLEQTAPGEVTYTEGLDYGVLAQTEPGEVAAAVTAVDIQLGVGNTSTSGCEAADFTGFPVGNIALIRARHLHVRDQGGERCRGGRCGCGLLQPGQRGDAGPPRHPGRHDG